MAHVKNREDIFAATQARKLVLWNIDVMFTKAIVGAQADGEG